MINKRKIVATRNFNPLLSLLYSITSEMLAVVGNLIILPLHEKIENKKEVERKQESTRNNNSISNLSGSSDASGIAHGISLILLLAGGTTKNQIDVFDRPAIPIGMMKNEGETEKTESVTRNNISVSFVSRLLGIAHTGSSIALGILIEDTTLIFDYLYNLSKFQHDNIYRTIIASTFSPEHVSNSAFFSSFFLVPELAVENWEMIYKEKIESSFESDIPRKGMYYHFVGSGGEKNET